MSGLDSAGAEVAAGRWHLRGGAATACGPVRRENQDAYRLVPIAGLGLGLILADGMGGHSGGAEAAEAAVDAAAERLQADGDSALLAEVVTSANLAVGDVRRRLGGNPGTTMVAAVLTGGRLSLAHVGDSRAYLLRGGAAVQLTSDHSVTGERVRAGTLDPEAARHDPRRNYVTRALLGDPVDPDLSETELAPGDVIVLCSDGLWEPLSDDEIARLSTGAGPEEASRRLVDAALAAGATDNVTVVVGLVEPATV